MLMSNARITESWVWLTSTLRWSLKPWWRRNLRKWGITLLISFWNNRTSDTYSYLTPSSICLTTQYIDIISHYLFCNLWLIHCNWILCRYLSYFVTALLHIEILEYNSKLASKLCRAYKRNVKKCGNYLPFRKEFTIEMENHTYQQK
jgi:hypothetical protein